MPKDRPKPDAIERWKTFLCNHRPDIAAMDFFQVPTLTFRVLYGWFAIGHARRRILHFGVTDHPTAAWVIQQLREAFPFATAPRYFVFDRDTIFSPQVVETVKSFGTEPKRSAFRCPWQNGVAERWIQTLRRELLDHVVVFNEAHLRRLLRDFVAYYHDDRTHLGLEKDAPTSRPVEAAPDDHAELVALPRLGGLHHRYSWRAPEGAWT
jgi:transposase InsO family protein